MSARAPSLVRTWSVGRYTATLTVPPLERGVVHAVIEWEPHCPKDLTADEQRAYRYGRDAAFRELGLEALVVEARG